jgi:NAD(P)-dependent dehydrogenase (short-subunit alcohol dehydrogenase family)
LRADQGRLDDLRRLTGQAEAWLDGLDIVVINASGAVPQMIDDVTEASYDEFMATSAKGPFFLIQDVGRTLRDGGRIISISTLNTRLHPPGEPCTRARRERSSTSPWWRRSSSAGAGSPRTSSHPGPRTPSCCGPRTRGRRSRTAWRGRR